MNTPLILTKQDRLMVLAVHPDDETLGAGGLIQHALTAGATVRVVFATDGDNNPWPQHILEHRIHISSADRARWGLRRRQEALAALATLGLDHLHTVFLGLPDQGITDLLTINDEKAINLLANELINWQPTHLVLPSLCDRHPDHSALAVMLDFALLKLPATQRCPIKLTYQIHGQYQILNADVLSVTLSARQTESKRKAILCHTTQTTLCGARFLRYASRPEIFIRDLPGARFKPSHQGYEISTGAGFLKVRVRVKTLMRWFGKPTLHFISNNIQDQSRQSLAMTLSGGSTSIYDCNSGAVVDYATISIRKGVMDANIPLSLFNGGDNLYIKLQSNWGFYDLLGWSKVQMTMQESQPAITGEFTVARQMSDVICVIPCYDVVEYCEKVIRETAEFCDHIIAIDDGSSDGTTKILQDLVTAMQGRMSLVTFLVNQGKGVALMAGFCEALNKFDFKTLVTLDGDGQHPPAEIMHLLKAMESGASMAIGSRQFKLMPARSRLGNTITSKLLQWLYADAPEDTQSGLRAFKRQQIEQIVTTVSGSRYETEFEILLLAISQKWPIASVPIPTIYLDKNSSSKFRPLVDSFRIIRTLIRFRFA
ncbi:MAG: PIG-L family deacetylase [Methylotenera sp.]